MAISTLPHFKPLSLGQILDQAIRLYRKNFIKFIGIIAVVQIPLATLQLISSVLMIGGISDLASEPTQYPTSISDIIGPGYFIGIGSSILLVIISFILVQGLATAALTKAISDSYLGETNSIFGAYKKIRDRWGGLLIALFLLALLIIAVLIWTLVPCIGWLSGPGLLTFLSFGIGQLIAPVVVVEKIGGIDAIQRAWDLARRRFWWVVGFITLMFIFSQLVVSGPSLLISYISQLVLGYPTDPFSTDTAIRTVIQSITSLFLSLVYLPLQISAMTLFYFDLRVRTEGFDIAMLTYQGTDESISLETIAAGTTVARSTNLITGVEIGNFVLLSLGVGIVYAVIVGLLLIFNLAFVGAMSGFPG